MIHLGGVFTDVLRKKEDPLGFSIIGVLILFLLIGIFFTYRRNRKNLSLPQPEPVKGE